MQFDYHKSGSEILQCEFSLPNSMFHAQTVWTNDQFSFFSSICLFVSEFQNVQRKIQDNQD